MQVAGVFPAEQWHCDEASHISERSPGFRCSSRGAALGIVGALSHHHPQCLAVLGESIAANPRHRPRHRGDESGSKPRRKELTVAGRQAGWEGELRRSEGRGVRVGECETGSRGKVEEPGAPEESACRENPMRKREDGGPRENCAEWIYTAEPINEATNCIEVQRRHRRRCRAGGDDR